MVYGTTGPFKPYAYPCPAGTFSDAIGQISEAAACTSNVCPAGYYCLSATNALTNPKKKCQPGYFCEAGTTFPATAGPGGPGGPCAAGTYSPEYGNKLASDCYSCPAGYYCLEGASTPTALCPSGYYCPEGTTSATPSTTCPAGTYMPAITGAKSVYECLACDPGWYCTGGAAAKVECPLGTYGPYTNIESTGGITGLATTC
jgi:hypothetical protein